MHASILASVLFHLPRVTLATNSVNVSLQHVNVRIVNNLTINIAIISK